MSTNVRLFVLAGLLVGLGLAVLISPFASSAPDGLEKVAAEEGFDEAATEHELASGPMADYAVAGIEQERVSTGVAGLVGTLVTFGIGLGLFAALRARRGRASEPAAG